MAKVKSFKASYGISAEMQGIWHKFESGIEIEVEPEDNLDDVKRKAWNTVKHEVEKKVLEVAEE